jgi:hypothetical protein
VFSRARVGLVGWAALVCAATVEFSVVCRGEDARVFEEREGVTDTGVQVLGA